MPDPTRHPGAPSEGNRFFQKLGVYLLGVAIGLIFLGWVQYRKHLAVKAEQAQQVPAAGQDPGP